MKLSISLLFILQCTINYFAQDVIVKKDGTKIEARVLEITSSTVKYKNYTQPEGPIRILETYEISEIVYEDGQWEKFEVDQPVSITTRPAPTPRIVNKSEPKDPFFSNGFFIDGLIGYSEFNRMGYYDPYYYDYYAYSEQTITKVQNLALSFRFGNKWYFGQGEKWRPGLQMTWVRLGIHIDTEYPETFIIGPKTFSICNIGFANIFKFNENIGLEANLSGGFNLDVDPDYGRAFTGVSFGPEVKFRLKKFAVGIDYMRIEGLDGTNAYTPHQWNVFSLSVGGKF